MAEFLIDWKNFHCTCCTCKSTAKEKILNMSTKTYWISKCVVLFSARFCPWKSKHIHRFIMEASNLEESDLKGMEVCSFGGTEMALPIDLIEQVNHGLVRYNAKLSRFMKRNTNLRHCKGTMASCWKCTMYKLKQTYMHRSKIFILLVVRINYIYTCSSYLLKKNFATVGKFCLFSLK